jgi:hypothetical protein
MEEEKTKHNFADGYQKLRDDAKTSELCLDDGVNHRVLTVTFLHTL